MKIALIHDDFMQSGGAESLFATIANLYPEAPIYTSVVNWSKIPRSIDPKRIKTSFIQKIPLAQTFFKLLLPLYPLAFESFDLKNYDLVISSTTRFAKSVLTGPRTIHVSYVNSLPRFLYNVEASQNYLHPVISFILKFFFKWLKFWDKVASQRVDFFIANSENVKRQIEKFYGRDADVIYPFADTDFFEVAKIHNWKLKSQNYFLIVSRLVKWKKVDIAIETAMQLGKNLIIVGDGPDKNRLKKIAQSSQNIKFAGKVTRENLKEYYQNCQALMVTQEEDFGIAQVEAQACGQPVIAYGLGGQKEIIKEGETGFFFDKQTSDSLKDAINAFFGLKWKSYACRKNSMRFEKALFLKNFKNQLSKYGQSVL